MRKRYLLLLTTLLLGFAMLAAERYLAQQAQQFNHTGEQRQPEFYGQQLSSQFFKANGRLDYQFTAQASRHNPNRLGTDFTQPVIIVHDEQDQRWKLQANFAESFEADGRVRLFDQVIAQSLSNEPPLILTGEELWYLPAEQLVSSQQLVTIVHGLQRISAQQMTVDLARQRISLSSEVNTHYEPE